MQCDEPLDQCEPFLFTEFLIRTGLRPKDLVQAQQHAMIQSVGDIAQGEPMPAAHEQHVDHEGDHCDSQPVSTQSRPHQIHGDP